MIDDAYAGKLKLMWTLGQNPMVTNPNLNYVHEALSKLEMLVVQELWDTETASFWQRPGADPKSIQTEVLLLPAAYFMEKEGTISGSGRLVQWRYAAVKPPGQAKADLEIIDTVFRKVRDLYAGSTDPKDEPLRKAAWSYPAENTAEAVLQEISGRVLAEVTLPDGKVLKPGDFVAGIGELQADGSTSSGVWIYAGVFGGGKNLTKRRDSKTDPSGLGMLPGLRLDLARQHEDPLQPRLLRRGRQALGRARRRSSGGTRPRRSGRASTRRTCPTPPKGPDTPEGQRAFRMNGEGVGRLIAAPYKDPDAKEKEKGLPRDGSYVPKDGPLPEFYEPVESPVANVLHPKVQHNPCAQVSARAGEAAHRHGEGLPVRAHDVLHRGALVRRVHDPQRALAQRAAAGAVVELPTQLAEKLRVKGGDRVKVSSARGEVDGEGGRHEAHAGHEDRRPGGARRLDALQLGVQGALDRSERRTC